MPREGNQLAELLVTDVGAGNGMHHCALVTHTFPISALFAHVFSRCLPFFLDGGEEVLQGLTGGEELQSFFSSCKSFSSLHYFFVCELAMTTVIFQPSNSVLRKHLLNTHQAVGQP